MLVGGLSARLTWNRIDMLITVGVNAVIRMIGKCDDFLHFCGVTRICEKGKQVLIDGRYPALDIGYGYLHVAGVQANVVCCIGLSSSQGSVRRSQGKVAVAKYAKAITDIPDILQGAEGGERPIVCAMLALDDVEHALGYTLNAQRVVGGYDALQDLRLRI